MEIKRMALMLGIDNERMRLEWRVKADYGNGFVDVTKTEPEIKEMLQKIIDGMSNIRTKEI
jgi:hypothetical protein